MQTKFHFPIFEIISQQNFTQLDLYQAIKIQPQLTRIYPWESINCFSSKLKQKHLTMIQTMLRELSTKHKFPCFYLSLRQLILLFHICILRNPNYSINTFQFIEQSINKMHLYSYIEVDNIKQTQLCDVVVYISQILNDLIPLLFEKGNFLLVISSIINITEVMTNSINLLLLWVIIEVIKNNLDKEGKSQFIQILSKGIKNRDSINFFKKIVFDIQPICLDYLMFLRQSEDSLVKSNFILQNNQIKKVSDGLFTWPILVTQAYNTKPKTGCPFYLSSRSLKQVYDNLLFLEVYCNSPYIQALQDYVQGQSYEVFVKFISGQQFINDKYQSKLQKWTHTLKDLQIQYKDKRKLQQLKQDISRLTL